MDNRNFGRSCNEDGGTQTSLEFVKVSDYSSLSVDVGSSQLLSYAGPRILPFLKHLSLLTDESASHSCHFWAAG